MFGRKVYFRIHYLTLLLKEEFSESSLVIRCNIIHFLESEGDEIGRPPTGSVIDRPAFSLFIG